MSKTTKEIFVENLIRIRKSKHMSQLMLAEKAEVSTGIIGEIENGHRNPTLKTIEKIANALETPAFMFFMDENDKEENLAATSNEERRKLIIDLLNGMQF